MDDLVPMTSWIRSAATPARGSIIDIMVSNRKDITMTMAYVINAIISPTCIWPADIPFAPNHTIATVIQFMISIIIGIIHAIMRLVYNCVSMSSVLASLKRSFSCSSRENARITGIPVKISRETRFMRSTSFCIILNFGIENFISTITTLMITATATTMIQLMDASVLVTMIIPPMASTGAYNTIRSSITSTICTCWISLVHLVISDAVENWSISFPEKEITLV